AVGVVSVVAHVAAAEYAAMVEALDRGDLPAARAIDRQLVPAFRGIMTRTQGAIAAKAALELGGVIPTRKVRLPLVPASDELVAAIKADLAEARLSMGARL